MICDRLKELRKELRLTQQEFADRLGIKRNTVATYEAGKSNPSDSAVILICNTFNVSAEWLRTGVGDMFLPNAGDELEALAKKYNYSAAVAVFIEKLVKLSPDQQATISDFLVEVAAGIQSLKDSDADLNKEKAPELSIDEKVEAYRRALEEEKEAAERSEIS